MATHLTSIAAFLVAAVFPAKLNGEGPAMNNVLRFDEVGIGDIASVGGKNASLGDLLLYLPGSA